jgi:rod shape-determining protein MreB
MAKKRKQFSWGLNMYKQIGIDLGTANTLVFLKGKGIIINEPSVVAFNSLTGDLLAVGKNAHEMLGRTPKNIVAIRPLREGVIDDYHITRIMLRYFITKSLKGLKMTKPQVLLSVPMGITQVEKRAVMEAAKQAGAREAFTIPEPVAAAIGAGLPVDEPRGSMVIDIGGGTSEVAILSLGGIVAGKSLRLGGNKMNEDIIRGIRKIYNLEIGDRTAEQVKMEIGYAINPSPEVNFFIKGKNPATGLPAAVEVTAKETTEFLEETLNSIIETVRSTLERTPPELASDIIEKGLMLTGGGALIKNIEKAITTATKLPVYVADDPLTCVARGLGKILEDTRLFKELVES